MKQEIIEEILKKLDSIKEYNKEEILQSIDKVENKIGYELNGYAKEDKPYRMYFAENVLNATFPKEKISETFIKKANENKNKIAYKCESNIKYGELAENVIKSASYLKSIGVKENDIVTLCVPSTPDAIAMFFAINVVGAISRPLEPTSNVDSIRNDLQNTNSKVFVTLDLNALKQEKMLKELNVNNVVYLSLNGYLPFISKKNKFVINKYSGLVQKFIKYKLDNSWINVKDILKSYELANLEDLNTQYKPNQVASIFSTSGSTGEAKRVCITNENFLSSIYKQLYSEFDITKDDSLFNPMPTSSSYFWYDIVLANVWGVTSSLSPLFSTEDGARQIITDESTVVLLGPILLEKIIEYVEAKESKGIKVDLSNKKHFISGGDILPLDLEQRANELFKKCNSKAIVENSLGTSETCGPAMNPNGVLKNKEIYKEGSVGVVFPGNDMAIFKYDSENNTRNLYEEDYNKGLLYYEIGEICYNAENPNVFKEYYQDLKNTELTKITHTDGTTWYHTGDLGYLDVEGHLFCSGRKNGLIVRSGQKVWSPKIENIIKSYDLVEDCAVIGVEDVIDKEVPVCFIQFKKDTNVELIEKIKIDIDRKIIEELNKYYVPKDIIEVENIPRNLMLKVKVKELNEIYNSKKANEENLTLKLKLKNKLTKYLRKQN